MGPDIEPSTAAGPPKSVPRWLWGIGITAGLLVTAQSVGVVYMGSGWAPPRGTLGINELADCDLDGFCAVSTVKTGSPAADAGISTGDRLKLERSWERHRTLEPYENVRVTVRHAGQDRHVELITAPKPYYVPTWIVDGLASLAVCLVSLVILGRAGRIWWSFLLGCSLLSAAVPGGYPRFWENDQAIFPWFFTGLAFAYMIGPVLMLAALRGFRLEVVGQAPRWLTSMIWCAGVGAAAATVWGTAVELNSRPVLGLHNGLLLTSLTWSITSLLAPLALVTGWREVPTIARRRYAFLWAAVTVNSIHPAVDPVIQATGNNYSNASWPVVIQLTSITLGPILFSYAILRHRVIDIGMAINRTLVYSTLSFFTLIVFGLIEWISERLLPFESRGASVIIEASVALGLFLTFHHVHGWIERQVERLFFHRWHANETELKTFLRRASYITQAHTLVTETVRELARFTGGASVAIYRAVPNGYEAVADDCNGSDKVDADLPALVAMRADHGIVRDAFVGGDLALPMLHRSEVTGFVALGPKPTGDPYRLDGEEVLAEAVSRVGLDLYALRVEELEATVKRLSIEVEALANLEKQYSRRTVLGPERRDDRDLF